MEKDSKIYIAGHRGLVGSAIVRQLKAQGYCRFIFRAHSELDLVNQAQVNDFFAIEKPDYVFLAAAKVGGIHANNTFPAEFIYKNLMIQSNIINAAYHNNVTRLLFLGSSCIYPRAVQQPMREEALLTDILEPTNEPYAIAKIAGIKLCESYNRQYGTDYRSVMPTNLYGIGDNFHPENSHVIPALIQRFHEAKINADSKVKVWGSGKPLREFLHVDDMASACLHIINLDKQSYSNNTQVMLSHINVGTGVDCSIKEMAEMIKKVVGFKGELVFDSSKPDGSMRKLMDVSRINALGWKAKIGLEAGLITTYEWFLKQSKIVSR
ncbi:MAG: GDP-L-fucose synthase [Pseudomonadota bacterium]